MRRFRFKLAVLFVACAAVMAVGVLRLHAWQIRRRVAELRVAANDAVEERRHADAAKMLRDYLALVPDDTPALERLADALAKLATPQAMLESASVYEQVLRRFPDRDDLRRRLVQAAMELGLTQLATSHLKILAELDPASGDVHALLGDCLTADARYADAAESFEIAVQLMPAQPPNYAKLADLYRHRLDQPDSADDVMDELVVHNAHSAAAFLLRSRYRRALGLLAEAADDVARAAEIAPDDLDVLLATAELNESSGKMDDARESLTRGIERHSDDARLYRILARVELRVGRRDAAIAVLRAGLEAQPDHPDLLWTLGKLYIESEQVAAARELIARLKRQATFDAPARLLDAEILMREERWQEARVELDGVVPTMPSTELAKLAQLQLGRCHGHLQDAVRQLAALRRALQLDPAWVPARWELALALAEFGRPADAVAELRQLLARPDAPASTRLVLAQLLFVQILNTPARERDWGEFDRELADLEHAEPQSLTFEVLRAAGLASRGNVAAACELLHEALDRQPAHLPLWLAYVHLLTQSGRADAAADALAEAESRVGAAAALPAVARAYESLGRLELSETKFEAALAARPYDPQTRWAAADFYLRHARTTEGERHLRSIVDANPRLPNELVAWARRGLAVVLATRDGDGEFQEAMRLIEQNVAAGVSPNDDQRAKAAVLATRADSAARREAIRLLDGASERWSPPPDERFLLVQLCEAEGQWLRARKHMLNLFVGPNPNATYLAYFVEHLIRHGETEEARIWLDRLAPLAMRDRTRLIVQLADALAHQGNSRDAAGLYRTALEHDDRHVVALNNLAWLAARGLGKTDEALALADRAIEVAGPRPELRDTRATVCLAAGRWFEAVRELEAAIQEAPSPTKYFHLAQARLAGRDVDAARTALRQAETLGLTKNTLHPTEQQDYDKLLFDMETLSTSD